MHDYFLYGAITLVLSTLFSMAGAGGAIAIIPILNFLGVDFTVAKAIGLFAGASTAITSSVMNMIHKSVEFKFVLPIAMVMLLFAPLGAYSSSFINEDIVKFFFMSLLLYSATMMMFSTKKVLFHAESNIVLLLVGAGVGFLSGLLGVGGGNILVPFLIFLGYAPKKVAIAVSFVVPFSALGSFATYASYVPLDWTLLIVVALCSIVGGFIGNYMMYFKLEQAQIKKIMAGLLYLIAFKMLWYFI